MAILVDYSQVFHAAMSVARNSPTNSSQVSSLGLGRRTLWGMLRGYKQKFGKQYGELVLCCDSGPSWRDVVFSHYKANRKGQKTVERIEQDEHYKIIRSEMLNNCPYKYVEAINAEADDIIAAVSLHLSGSEKVLIVSEDKDFFQLQQYHNIVQYYQRRKAWAPVSPDPETALREFIMRGDVGDGVPNILSDDDCIVTKGKRQTSLGDDKIKEWAKNHEHPDVHPYSLPGWKRNKQLIDFRDIPLDVKTACIDAFENAVPASRSGLFNFFIESKMNSLMSNIGDF